MGTSVSGKKNPRTWALDGSKRKGEERNFVPRIRGRGVDGNQWREG